MSSVTINGTLILNGNLSCSGDVTVTSQGLVTPVPDSQFKKSYFNPETQRYTTSIGVGRTITTFLGGITVQGLIVGDGLGFNWNEGPGCNSTLYDANDRMLQLYGATHAGVGAYVGDTTSGIPLPKAPYGSCESPVSLGSGSGYFYDASSVTIDGTTYPVEAFGVGAPGGGAIKLEARSGVVQIDGTVTMNGINGTHTGGGAGGSVWIHGWDVTGSGLLSAVGGTTDSTVVGGGGGGGYISIWNEHRDGFVGTASVVGQSGGGDGKILRIQREPNLVDEFHGRVLNSKWWDGSCAVNSTALFLNDSSNESLISSRFQVVGQSFEVACDYTPIGIEPGFYTAFLRLWIDSDNWVAVAKRKDEVWGMSRVNAFDSVFAREVPYESVGLRIVKQDSTFACQYWDASSAAPLTAYLDVLPEIANSTFSVQMGLSQMTGEDATRVDHLRLNTYNITNMRAHLQAVPTCPEIAMNVVSGTSQFQDADYYMVANDVRWDPTGLADYPGTFIIESRTLTATDIANKAIQLGETPINVANVAVDLVHGTSQEYGVDFGVVLDQVVWSGYGLDGFLVEGDILRIEYATSPFAQSVPLRDLLSEHDTVRFIYSIGAGDATAIQGMFDNARVYGAVYNAQSSESVLYVDSANGSDTDSGRQLDPLKTLATATAWAKTGGTVVLYDGTYNPMALAKKSLTIRGAEGSQAYVTSQYSQDQTGAWKRNALSFDRCHGFVDNLLIGDSTTGIYIVGSPEFEVRRCTFSNVGTAVDMTAGDPNFYRNTVRDSSVGFSFAGCDVGAVASNVIYDTSCAVFISDSSAIVVNGNTIDRCETGVKAVQGSTVTVASNNLTDCTVGIDIIGSSVRSYVNNFFGTSTQYLGTPVDTSNNSSVDPWYAGVGDYHLLAGSPDTSTGLGQYDPIWIDRDGVDRTGHIDKGAYQFVDRTHVGDWYVAGVGNDWLNNGDATHPFCTVDRAFMMAPDSTVHVDGGHYDTYFLSLSAKALDLNELTILTKGMDSTLLTYHTLTATDMTRGYVALPGFVQTVADYSNVAAKIIGGPDGTYGSDYVVQFGSVVWKDYSFEPLVDVGYTLRIEYLGRLQAKALNTLSLHAHYSQLNTAQAVYVSPNGSDSTVMGGDGTDSGGDGSRERPYRSIQRALDMSVPGDSIVAHAGEYDLFSAGLAGRTIVVATDKTAVGLDREFVEDRFAPKDFRWLGSVLYDEVPWDMTASGGSWVTSNAGWLSLSFDGTNEPWATSTFDMTGNWEVQASLRNVVDPLWMTVTGADDTAALRYDGTNVQAFAHTGGRDFRCWHDVDVPIGLRDQLVVDYLTLSSVDIAHKWAPLGFIPDGRDCTAVAVNVVGGVPQNYGDDFIVEDSRVIWDGLALDGELDPGDMLRVVYMDSRISGPVRIRISLTQGMFKVEAYDWTSWRTVLLRNVVGNSSSWRVSFYMGDPDVSVNHHCTSGRGFVTDFLAVSDSMSGSGLVTQLKSRTERLPVVLHKSR